MRKMEYTGKYHISRHKLSYAKSFSLQYNDWIDQYNMLKDSVKGISYSESVQGGKNSDPTQKLAAKRAELKEKIMKIEHAAVDAGGEDLASYILKAVTNEFVTYDVLYSKYHMPCGRTLFYEKRRKYYYLLSQEI